MGLERITAVLQGVLSNYDTDLFTPLLAAIGNAGGRPVRRDDGAGATCRCASSPTTPGPRRFLIADGVVPSNEWRGYVLRKIMRRAMRHGKHLGIDGAVPLPARRRCSSAEMGDAYPGAARAARLRRACDRRRGGAVRVGADGSASRSSRKLSTARRPAARCSPATRRSASTTRSACPGTSSRTWPNSGRWRSTGRGSSGPWRGRRRRRARGQLVRPGHGRGRHARSVHRGASRDAGPVRRVCSHSPGRPGGARAARHRGPHGGGAARGPGGLPGARPARRSTSSRAARCPTPARSRRPPGPAPGSKAWSGRRRTGRACTRSPSRAARSAAATS